MRICDDDLLAARFLTPAPASPEFFAALGRVLVRHPAAVRFGTPCHVWAQGGGEVAAGWVFSVTAAPSSLWGELELRLALAGAPTWLTVADDPLSALVRLRASGPLSA